MNQDIIAEHWKPINDYDGIYMISSHGRVKRLERMVVCGHGGKQIRPEKILNIQRNKKGYAIIQLYKESKFKTFIIHRLVAEHFLPEPQTKETVDHLDGDKLNNLFTNLEWVSAIENHKRAVRQKRHQHGERHSKAILTNKDVMHIRREFVLNSGSRKNKTEIYNKLCAGYGLSRITVKEICQNKSWMHVGI